MMLMFEHVGNRLDKLGKRCYDGEAIVYTEEEALFVVKPLSCFKQAKRGHPLHIFDTFHEALKNGCQQYVGVNLSGK